MLGGAERYAWELARWMARDTDTSLLSFGPRDREFQEARLLVRFLGNPWHVREQSLNPLSLKMLPEILRADVVHCHQRHILSS